MGTGLKIGDYVKPYSYAGSTWIITDIYKPSRRSQKLYNVKFAFGRETAKSWKETTFNRSQITKVPKKQLQKHLQEVI